MDNKKKVARNLLYSVIGQIIAIAVGLLLPRLFILGYGSAVNGVISSVNQILVYLGLFEAGVGATTLIALYKPVAEHDKESISSILSATNLYYKRTGTFYFIFLILLSLLFPFLANEELNYFSVFLIVFFSGICNVISFYFQGKYKLLLQAEGKNYIITNLTSVTTLLVGIAKIVLLSLKINVVLIIVLTAIIQLIPFAYIMFYVGKKYSWIDLKVPPDAKALEQRNFVLLHQISDLIFYNTDVLILTFFCDFKVVSVYSLYKLIFSHLESVISIVSHSFTFLLGQTYQTDIEKYKKNIDVYESLYTGFSSALLSVALYLTIPFLKLYTAGVTDINYVDYIIAILFTAVSFLTAARSPMMITINFAGHFKKTTWQTLLEAVINLVTSLIGVYFLGIYGVLLGTVIALVYRTNFVVLYSNIKLMHRSPFKTYFIHFINFVLLVALQFGFSFLFNEINSYLIFVLCGVAMVLISLGVFLCVHSILFKDFRNTAKSVFNKKLKIRRNKNESV